jgi:IclR family transcriptional regulator, KDG regulon repressor
VKLGSLTKSLQVIEALRSNPHGLSIAELSQLLGFPTSTIHHILSTFRSYDYVAQNPETKKYSLGFRFLTISTSILDNLDVRKSAYTHLRKLHQRCNEAVHLSILRNGQVTYVDKIQGASGLSLATYIGFSTDPHAAAGGKVLLSELSPNEIKAMYKDRPLKKYGKNTVTNIGQLLEELENIRKQGYAIDSEEYYEGVRCVAAPIRAGGRIAAALSITGSIFSMTMERINRELIEMATKTARDISSELEW